MFPTLDKKFQIFKVCAGNFCDSCVGNLPPHVHNEDSSVQICTKETFCRKHLYVGSMFPAHHVHVKQNNLLVVYPHFHFVGNLPALCRKYMCRKHASYMAFNIHRNGPINLILLAKKFFGTC